MEDNEEVVYQGDFFRLSETRKRLIGTKASTWKPKYLIFRLRHGKPFLEYHKRKPKNNKKSERTLTDSVELWPSYKVEKLKNARGRTFVCEITSPNFHTFISANEEKEIDILVFLLQVQIRLKDNIRDDLISVIPEDSECQRKIGANNSRCVLHASPWGLTLALEKTRALLAQWPLKSIRYYEVSEPGHFNIEAGRVAPMGEGLFSFRTQRGEEDSMYDLVDSYIVNTLDRVKPTQKGTPEEIEDYIREHDCLHSLTTIIVCPPGEPEIRNILSRNWNIGSPAPEDSQMRSTRARDGDQPSSQGTVQSSSLVINLERPGDSSTDPRRNSSESRSNAPEDPRLTDRRPPLPRAINSGATRRSKRREHSLPRKVDVTDGHGVRSVSPDRLQSKSSNAQHRSRHDNKSPQGNLRVDTELAQSNNAQHQHTEFYHLTSPNMKIRVSKSPIVVKNPNKVGRAEYLLSQQLSGVKSPTTNPSIDHQPDGSATAGTVTHSESPSMASRNGQSNYGGHNSLDRHWDKLRKDLSGSEHSVASSASSFATPSGYINLQQNSGSIQHHSQKSAPETILGVSNHQYSRHNSKDSINHDHGLSPPVVRHIRQRSADEVSGTSLSSSDQYYNISRPSSAGNRVQTDPSRQESGEAISEDSPESGASDVSRTLAQRQVSGYSGLDQVDSTVGDWLISASCEDLSDHMRTVIYDDGEDEDIGKAKRFNPARLAEDDGNTTLSSNASSSSSDKPPLPFTGLKKFHDNTDINGYRDRSTSFGYINVPLTTSGSKPLSSAPSAHLIRKMVNARAKQETLRKSLSNPNFLNLGSKEHLFNLKSSNNSGSSTKLDAQNKQKSKSFSSLFPAIKKAFSRESLGHSRSTTPERRSSRSTTPERRSSFSFKRRSSDAESNFKRQNSFHSIGEMTIKGIRMTARSRSFRRVREAKSVEVLSRTPNDADDVSRLSSATTMSTPAGANFHNGSDDNYRNTSGSFLQRSSAPVQATNPNFTVTARIDLNPPVPPLPTLDEPPPLPARARTDGGQININQPLKLTKSSSHGPGLGDHTSGYQNTSDIVIPPPLESDHGSLESSHGYRNLDDSISERVSVSRSASDNSGLANSGDSSSKESSSKADEISTTCVNEALENYSNGPSVNVGQVVKPGEEPAPAKRLLVSDLVAKMEENCHQDSRLATHKSPNLPHKAADSRNKSVASHRTKDSTVRKPAEPRAGVESHSQRQRPNDGGYLRSKAAGVVVESFVATHPSGDAKVDMRPRTDSQKSGTKSRVSAGSQGSDTKTRLSSGSQGSDANTRLSGGSQGSETRIRVSSSSQGSDERRTSAGAHGGPVRYVKTKSSSGDTSVSPPVPGGLTPKTLPSPFQPIPFRLQKQNEIRSVKAPTPIKKGS